MSYKEIIFEQQGQIAILTLNRPEVRNVITEQAMIDEILDACQRVQDDTSISVLILTGAGTAFSAGGNVKEMYEKKGIFAGDPDQIRNNYRRGIQRIPLAFQRLDVPTIAAVNGPAIGLGNDVACLADMRIAADTAIFGATFLKIGLVPGDGGAWILPRTIGMARAAELFFTGDTIDAATAREWGLVSKVVPGAALMDEARALAARICRQPPDVLRMTKRLMREGQGTSFDTIMEMSASMQAIAHLTADHAEAVTAFFEKRTPEFKGE